VQAPARSNDAKLSAAEVERIRQALGAAGLLAGSERQKKVA
jgi:hypothetical protein